jgi:hypothetical protein
LIKIDVYRVKHELRDSLNRGPRLVNYTGHGAVDLWGGQLLTAADARGLTNHDRLPFVVVMTCLNGYSHDPSQESLAEAFLNAPQGGVIGVWASSGSTLPEEQALMNMEWRPDAR